jgi:hypothetical protein
LKKKSVIGKYVDSRLKLNFQEIICSCKE